MMLVLAVVTLLGLATVAVAAASSAALGNAQAAAFAKRVLYLEARGQTNRSYALLHPAQQKLISRSRYVACLHSSHPRRVKSVSVFRVADWTIAYSGIPQHEVKAVSVDVIYKDGGRTTFTMSAVPVAGAFRWVFSEDAAARAATGRCPYGG